MSSFSITSVDVKASIVCSQLGLVFNLNNWVAQSTFFDNQARDRAVAVMSADGILSSGAIHTPETITITLQPNSDSIQYLQAIETAMKAPAAVLIDSATFKFNDASQSFTFARGTLVNAPTAPGAGQTLNALAYRFVFQSGIAS